MIVKFYKNNKKAYSCYANSIAEVKAKPTAYYREFDKDTYITEIEFKNPIIEDGQIREATRDELVAQGVEVTLKEGEIIQDKKIIKIEKPSYYHYWKENKWEVDLEKVKEIKRNEFKLIREKKQNEPLEFKGNLFQVEYPKDTKNFDLIQSELVRMKLRDIDIKPYLNQTMKWTLLDNTDIELTISEVLDLATAYTNRYKQVHYTCNQVLYSKIAKAKTVEEIKSIKWE